MKKGDVKKYLNQLNKSNDEPVNSALSDALKDLFKQYIKGAAVHLLSEQQLLFTSWCCDDTLMVFFQYTVGRPYRNNADSYTLLFPKSQEQKALSGFSEDTWKTPSESL